MIAHNALPKLGKKSLLEELFAQHMREKNCPVPEREFQFCPGRKWAFDFAWPDFMVAVEIEGGVWSGGRHVRPEGFERDIEKYNAATIMGYTLIRVTGRMVKDGSAIELVNRVLVGSGLDQEKAGRKQRLRVGEKPSEQVEERP